MATVAFLPPRTAPLHAAATRERPPRHAQGGPFWSHGVSLGAGVILAATGDVDARSRAIAALPARTDPTRPMVGQYLFMVKTLAAAWSGHSRPALLSTACALRHYGDSFASTDAGPLGAALLQAVSGRAEPYANAARIVDGLIRRLAAPLEGFAALHQDFGSYLAQMAGASSDLETDTVLVTQRLQADHVHAFVLAQHVHTLQAKLSDARARRHGCWLLGAEAEQAQKEITMHSAALESVSHQLEQLRTDQQATLTEAAYLQALLPAVSTYLGAVDRVGVGIHAALSGTQALQEGLIALKQALLGASLDCAAVHAELQASLSGWRELGARLSALPQEAL